MTKLTVSFFILLFLSYPISAQTKFGFQLGFNSCNLHSSYTDQKAIPGFNTGFFVTQALAKRFSVSASLLLSQKGYSDLYIPWGTTYNRLYYISVPVLMDYKVGEKLFFSFGPEFNYLIKAKMKNSNMNKEVTDNYKKFDTCIDAGISYCISKKFITGVRYNFGLSKVVIQHSIDLNGGQGVTSSYGNNRVLQINVGYIF